MNPFTYVSVTSSGQAIAERGSQADSAFLAGGTNLIDDMKLGVEQHSRLVDINALPLGKIEALPNGGVRIGAMVRNSDLAYDEQILAKYPLLSQALLSGASAQLRNMASTGGNLLQRTRCYYFRDPSARCNKRQPGSGCDAIDGFNRIHAVLGTSDQCIATHPSDMCVALAALDAEIETESPGGKRAIAFQDFYVPYGENPVRENILGPGELIVAVVLPPAQSWFTRSTYLKVRDRASYEFVLSSAAVALDLDGGNIRQARIALGGVATKPWRSIEAEKALAGKKADNAAFSAAAEAALAGAKPQRDNAFKIELCKRTIVRALETAAAIV